MPQKKKRSKLYLLLYLAILALLFVGGYFLRGLYLAYAEADPVVGPGEGQGDDQAPVQPGEDTYPGEDDQETPPQPSRYPPPPGEILEIADGDYFLALVTKQTYLGHYKPSDLMDVPPRMSYYQNVEWRYQLRREALDQLAAMWEVARSDGLTLTINSAYRSYETQEGLFTKHASRYGEEEANRFSARPGQSEHQLGTTVDFATPAAYATQGFADTAEGIWLAEHAHRFGFVLSFPEGSEPITGYIFEPWHYRYIGVEAAQAWKESGEVLAIFLQRYPQEFLP